MKAKNIDILRRALSRSGTIERQYEVQEQKFDLQLLVERGSEPEWFQGVLGELGYRDYDKEYAKTSETEKGVKWLTLVEVTDQEEISEFLKDETIYRLLENGYRDPVLYLVWGRGEELLSTLLSEASGKGNAFIFSNFDARFPLQCLTKVEEIAPNWLSGRIIADESLRPSTRYWTAESRFNLARRFNLPNTNFMQDWAIEIADPERVEEFLSAYESDELDEDERFTLMDTLLESFGEMNEEKRCASALWIRTLSHLLENTGLHAYQIWERGYLDDQIYEGGCLSAEIRCIWLLARVQTGLHSRHG